MLHDDIAILRGSPAWRLLRADNAALILSFLGTVFVEENVREISASALAARLDDELYSLAERGVESYPRAAKAYLDEWATPESGWLRKYYPLNSDEPHFDATPAVEKAVAWVRALGERAFVGTESRLNTVFELLRQLVYGSETDAGTRREELLRRRAEIDAEIAAVDANDFRVLDSAGRRDRYQQFADLARALLADFREVEANFRQLDRDMRERIATWDGSKGELLDEIVGSRSLIADSDQGRSFQAFYDLLLSSQRLAELTDLLERVQRLDSGFDADPRLRYIHHDWLDAGERAQTTVRQLSEQLRRFLDDQVWLENRRVMELVRGIEAKALQVREHRVDDFRHELDASAPTIALPMERPLYTRATSAAVDSTGIENGDAQTDTTALFEQTYVDPAPLIRSVRKALQRTAQVTLVEVVSHTPLRHGLAELVTYLSLDADGFSTVFDEASRDTLEWTDPAGVTRAATLPRVTYTRDTDTEVFAR